MKKYLTPEILVSSYVLSSDVAVNLGSNIWEDNDELLDDDTTDE